MWCGVLGSVSLYLTRGSPVARVEDSLPGETQEALLELAPAGEGLGAARRSPAPARPPPQTEPSAPPGGSAALGREMSPQGNYCRPSPINHSSFTSWAQEVSLHPIPPQCNKRP